MEWALKTLAEIFGGVQGFEERGLFYFTTFARYVLWGVALVFLGSNLGFDMSGVFAGFGTVLFTLGFAVQD